MAADADLLTAIDWSSLSAALPQMRQGRVDTGWLLSWYGNAQDTIDVWLAEERATAEQGEVLRSRIDEALRAVPGLQVAHDRGDSCRAAASAPVGGPDHRPLATADPTLHEHLQNLIHEIGAGTPGWVGVPQISLTLARRDGSDYLVLAVQDYSLGIRVPSPNRPSERALRHAVSNAVAAAVERAAS